MASIGVLGAMACEGPGHGPRRKRTVRSIGANGWKTTQTTQEDVAAARGLTTPARMPAALMLSARAAGFAAAERRGWNREPR